MTRGPKLQKTSYVFLCASLPLTIGAVAALPLRVLGLHHVIGGAIFTAMTMAVWLLGAWAIRTQSQSRRQMAIAGALLVAPFAFVALLWVGIGPPWLATAAVNQMRYLVLIAMAAAVAGGFVVLKDALSDAGERVFSSMGFAAIVLAGPLYLVWAAILFEGHYSLEHLGKVAATVLELNETEDLLLFVAGAMTYLAAAAFAASLRRAGWLGLRASRVYVTVSLVALLFLGIRGIQFPDPNALSEPWYMSPGLVAGIPAVPFVIPFFFGVLLLRRAGSD